MCKIEIEDELVELITTSTKTVALFDRFEGNGIRNKVAYHRLVMENGLTFKLGKGVYFNLVLERGRYDEYEGRGMTITFFKEYGDAFLTEYMDSEITDEIIEKYKDKDKFYRFTKPYLIRAQNSINRTGYGWQWNWNTDGSLNDYQKGTFYGETTNYYFVGTYISSDFLYKPNLRTSFKN